MTPLTSTIDVDRPPADVFAYATDPSRFHEWQKGVVSGGMEGESRPTVGSRCITTRRIGFAERPIRSEVTEMNPPRTWGVHGIDGPIRATVNVTVEPLDGDDRSRLTIELDFEGHGIGKMLVPLVVRREAQKEMPTNLRRLKERLEGTTGQSPLRTRNRTV
jgi:carbon monoxide dehydrogenase subunit G